MSNSVFQQTDVVQGLKMNPLKYIRLGPVFCTTILNTVAKMNIANPSNYDLCMWLCTGHMWTTELTDICILWRQGLRLELGEVRKQN